MKTYFVPVLPAFVAASLCLLTFSGCGGGSADTESVSGKVLFADGSPAANVDVAFIPTDTKGLQPVATTDASGNFELTTETEGDGAPKGEYKVAIGGVDESGKPLVADKYGDPAKSGLTAKVESGSNAFEFKVEKPK